MQNRLEIEESKPTDKTVKNHINFMSFNIGCLPLLGAINARFLRSNHIRTQLITERMIQWNTDPIKQESAPDIICFQEALAIETRYTLKQKLSPYYPYDTENVGQHLRGSGLLILSKYPILEAHYKPFSNVMTTSERLAIKGLIGAKLQIDDNHFITVYDTHLESGGDITINRRDELYGTTSWRRGEQMGRVYDDIQLWSTEPPKSKPTMQHMKTFLLGDLNTSLNDERKMCGISSGKSKRGYKKDMKKYPGQYDLFRLLDHTVPANFTPSVEKAKKENLFTGSYLPKNVTSENKKHDTPVMPYDAEPRVIDGVFCNQSLDSTTPELESRILSHQLNGEGGVSPICLSDHFPVWARWTPSLFAKQKPATPTPEVEKQPVNQCAVM